jgi:hypothetical protein
MPYSFPSGKYDEVRAAIGLDVDSGDLPDSLLDLDVYKGEAQRYIERNLTESEYTNSTWTDAVTAAAIYYIAFLAIPRIRIITSERVAGGNLSYANVDLKLIAERLSSQSSGTSCRCDTRIR